MMTRVSNIKTGKSGSQSSVVRCKTAPLVNRSDYLDVYAIFFCTKTKHTFQQIIIVKIDLQEIVKK